MTNLEDVKIETIVNNHAHTIKKLFCSMGIDLQNLLLKEGYELKSPSSEQGAYNDSKPFLFALARLEQLVLGPIKMYLYNPDFDMNKFELLNLEPNDES